MIKVEGYKAFHGDMKIVPKNVSYPPFYIFDKDWLYKPDTDCWYCDGRSFSAEICEVKGEDQNEEKNVHIVIQNGCVINAFADTDVDVIIYDLDTQDPEMLAEVEKAVAQLPDFAHEVEIM